LRLNLEVRLIITVFFFFIILIWLVNKFQDKMNLCFISIISFYTIDLYMLWRYCFYSRTELVSYWFYNRTQLVVYLYHKYYLGLNSVTPAAEDHCRAGKRTGCSYASTDRHLFPRYRHERRRFFRRSVVRHWLASRIRSGWFFISLN
jgi:hypothetical protein